MSDCPSTETLHTYLADELGYAHRSTEVHVQDCERCQRALERLTSGLPGDFLAAIAPEQLAKSGRDGLLPVAGGPTEGDITVGAGEGREGRRADPAGPSLDPTLAIRGVPDRGRIGPYQVVGKLGEGGMGVVLKAFDPGLNRFVAIKFLSSLLAQSAVSRLRFQREARAAAAVKHPHVVTIHAVGEHEGLPYFVMEYISGITLADRLRRDGILDVAAILRIGSQAAAGLAAAHSQGLIHRDIKPENILLENGVERVMLTDFGLARVADERPLTESGMLCGTLRFMSPEQASGVPIDHRSDLFSLGSVLYELSTGVPAFSGSAVRVFGGPQTPRSFVHGIAGEPGRLTYGCQARASSPSGARHPRSWAPSTSDRSMRRTASSAACHATRPLSAPAPATRARSPF